MTALLVGIFCVCSAALFYTYVGYPWLLARWAWRRGQSVPRPEVGADLPSVSVLVAAYNEAGVIGEKLRSLLASDLPPTGFEVLVGDDASTDGTGGIVRRFAEANPGVHLVPLPGRTGKPGVMNELARLARGEVLIFTDADVMFAWETIRQIAAWFRSPEVRLVAANVASRGAPGRGVAAQEEAYVRREIQIKRRQCEVSGVVIAPFGACFAIRRSDFVAVPEGFSVDDFYISMQAQRRGGRAVQAIDALCYEDVASASTEQFRRKVRIGRGNFQNLMHFLPVALRVWTPLGFHFVSHKVLRWFGPFWLAGSMAAAGWLAGESRLFLGIVIAMAVAASCPLVDRLVPEAGERVRWIRYVSYFVQMNVALGVGFLAWLCGRRGSVWTPTRRAAIRAHQPIRGNPSTAAPARR